MRWTPIPTAFAAFMVPYATGPVRIVYRQSDGPRPDPALKMTAASTIWTGLAISAGLLI